MKSLTFFTLVDIRRKTVNFRLKIARIHADWLINRKEYQQALDFDQLREILRDHNGDQVKDGCLRGFREGEINFPPTYKYVGSSH
jgi:hypothetical protein